MMAITQLLSNLVEPKSPTSPSQLSPNSPNCSPSLVRRFPSAIFAPQAPKVVFEFATPEESLGKVVVKILEDTGELGTEFESLATGSNGYGYQGSRVYASCRNEWCLMGDVLYKTEDPQKEGSSSEEEDVTMELPTVYKGYTGIIETQSPHQDTTGSVVLVGTDLDAGSNTWTLGPQFKICLGESLIRSGRVVGQVTEGLEVAHEVSQQFETSPRITISYCGSC
ncbi:peptidyl-prolyl cis-trans isomerase-like isoform X2 [Macrobrachium nipponense]|uniref:peptidyl-prolyl cis-trans isomerase-like isoform X2 n=1 Tax=Macrobrachium nipponense TaxID=159736 RepID=UPI0030C899BB